MKNETAWRLTHFEMCRSLAGVQCEVYRKPPICYRTFRIWLPRHPAEEPLKPWEASLEVSYSDSLTCSPRPHESASGLILLS